MSKNIISLGEFFNDGENAWGYHILTIKSEKLVDKECHINFPVYYDEEPYMTAIRLMDAARLLSDHLIGLTKKKLNEESKKLLTKQSNKL